MGEFADWFRKEMAERGVTLGQIATTTGLRPATLSNLATGKRKPKYDTALKLADYFHADAAHVLRLAGHKVLPALRINGVSIKAARLASEFVRAADLSVQGQERLARCIGPILDDIDREERERHHKAGSEES